MTDDDRSLERAARSWLEAGPTQAPDRAVDDALHRIQTTPQERDLRVPWRLPTVFTNRLGVAVVVAALAVITGATLITLRPSSNVGPPATQPATAPASSAASTPAAATPAPAASPRALTYLDAGLSLSAAEYRVAAPFTAPFSLSLPGGWQLDEVRADFVRFSQIVTPGSTLPMRLTIVSPTGIYADTCRGKASAIGSGVAGLVNGLAAVHGMTASPVTDKPVGVRTGRGFVLDHQLSASCGSAEIRLLTQKSLGVDQDATIWADGRDEMVVLIVNDHLLVLDGGSPTSSGLADLAALDAILRSVLFE